MNKLTVMGVNGGNGAVLYPFKEYLLCNIEARSVFRTPGNIQWKLNFGNTPLYQSLEQLPHTYHSKSIDVIIGHPDCGHSSMLAYSRAKKLSNPRDNASVTMFFQAIKLFMPELFLMENLPKFLSTISETEIKESYPQYNIKFIKGSVSKFGNSQVNRKRLVIVGVKKKGRFDIDKFKLPKRENIILSKTKELIGDLSGTSEYPKSGHIREDISEIITMYGGYKISLKEAQKRWNNEFANKSRWEVKDRKYSRAPGVYRNLPDKYPSTVRKGNREFNSNGLMMSPRERARIQGIPDSFQIWVDLSKKKSCINKGRITVTKCYPYEISLWLLKRIKKHRLELNY